MYVLDCGFISHIYEQLILIGLVALSALCHVTDFEVYEVYSSCQDGEKLGPMIILRTGRFFKTVQCETLRLLKNCFFLGNTYDVFK